jgi:hypothetical protein
MTEDKLQSNCVQWARNTYPALRFFGVVHVPNGGTRHKAEVCKLRSMGVVAGFPDLIITPPSGKIFFIEMKDGKKDQSKEQIECKQWMNDRGIEYYLIRDQESFEKLINEKMAIS